MTNYAAIAALSPKHWWKLDETSGTSAADSGSIPVAGVYTNGPTLNQPAMTSDGGISSDITASFDGVDDMVTVATSPAWSAWTLAMWFKPTALHTGVLFSHVYSGNHLPLAIATNPSLFGGSNVQQLCVGMFNGAWAYGLGPVYQVGKAYFLVATSQSSGRLKLWVTGQKKADVGIGAFTPPATSLRIGRRWDNPDYGQGNYASVALWDAVLSDADILSMHPAPVYTEMDIIGGAVGSQPSPWMPFGEKLTAGGGGGGGTPPTTGQLWPRSYP